MIDLQSSDGTELTVPATVTIPQGETSAAFDLTVLDDGFLDGTQAVTVTASAETWESGSAHIPVIDDDPGALAIGEGCAPGEAIPAPLALFALGLSLAFAWRSRYCVTR